ncbi:hypothetical protein ACWEPC_47735, partial [Nonomuraea sp. NPDC004297]
KNHSLDRHVSRTWRLSAMLPAFFVSKKGVRYNLKASGVSGCPDSYHKSSVRTALRKASCTKMVKGAYVNPNAPSNRRIMVSVWVVPLKSAGRAGTFYSRVKGGFAEDWGIVCPRKGSGSGLCRSGSWGYARSYGWTGATHRYAIHTMALYTNRSNSPSTKPWLTDAAKAAWQASGPVVYHGED